MKNALFKDFIREIKGNKGRFMSIFFIVLLGAAFFSGIRSSGGDMKYTADYFYDETDMMDIRVISTLGLTDDDLEDIRNVEGVEEAVGGYTREALVTNGVDEYAIKIIALTDNVNRITLSEGRMPEKANECIIDDALVRYMDFNIGDTITVASGTGNDISEDLTETEFTIVGKGKLPYYLDLTRGVGSIGDGQLKGFISVLPEAFDMDIYTEIYVRVSGAKELNTYYDEYKDLISEVADRIESAGEYGALRRYDEIYSEAAEKIQEGKDKLSDAEKELADAKNKLDDGRVELDDARIRLEDAQTKLEEGKKELDEGKKELDEAKTELDNAKKEIEDGEAQLAEAKAKVDSGERELADVKAQVDSGERELAEAKALVDLGEAELAQAKGEIDSSRKTLDEAKTELDENKKLLDESRTQLEDGEAEIALKEQLLDEKALELEAGWATYNESKAAFDIQKAEFEEAKEQLGELRQQLDAVNIMLETDPENTELLVNKQILEETIAAMEQSLYESEEKIAYGEAELAGMKQQLEEGDAGVSQGREAIEAAKADLNSGWQQYEEGLKAWQAGSEQYEEGLKAWQAGSEQYEEGLKAWQAGSEQYEEGLKAWQAGKRQYEEGLKAWQAGKQQYEEALAQFDEGKREYEEGLAKYEDSLKEWEEGFAEYKEGLAEYEDGKKEYEDGLKEWEEGNAEYIEKAADAQKEIDQGKAEIADAEDELAELEKPQWYVLDRDKIQSCVSYSMDGDRIDNLGNVFPVIFFLVAALVSLTCMTRMVEEQRQQIGTLKALGYSGFQIAAKYIGYALLATVSGAFIGVIAGEKILPGVVLSSYGMLYTGLPYYFTPLNWGQGGLAIALSILCTGGAAFAACYRELKDKPAELMRPEAPKSGRRIFLERLTFIWKRLNFTQKATIRNLFRYKKRFIMTIIGIGGCMGLMMVGYGLRDSIKVVAQNQYIEIFKQNGTVSVDTASDEEELSSLMKAIEDFDGITEYLKVCGVSVTLSANDVDRSAQIYVPDDTDKVFDFVRFRDRVTKESYDFPSEGVILSEKTADMMHVKTGDIITIQKGDNSRPVETEVVGIIENYVQHYAFFTENTYEELFKEKPEYNYVYLKYDETTDEFEKALGTELLKEDACSGVSFTRDLEKNIDDMLATLDLVIWVLIGSAALLAFVVLYNLNSINITERRRELATLKVLGFNNMEVAMYIYRENILLTLLGIVAGAVLGRILHLFTVTTVEVDLMMFGRNIGISSYFMAAVITLAFSVLVNLVMFYHFKKIDMVESLKSVE